MNKEEKEKLQYIVDRIVELKGSIKEAQDEIKELCDDAKEKLGINAKVVKQLAKEQGMSETERMAQRLHEEEVDKCRAALGLLADTPLGEAAIATTEEPDYHVTRPKYRAPTEKARASAEAIA